MAPYPRLLLVEDVRADRLDIQEELYLHGFEVDAAANVKEAHRFLQPLDGPRAEYAALLSDFDLGDSHPESFKTGLSVYQYARRIYGNDMPPFIGTSSEISFWENLKLDIHLVPKRHFRWDGIAIRAKLKELGLTPLNLE